MPTGDYKCSNCNNWLVGQHTCQEYVVPKLLPNVYIPGQQYNFNIEDLKESLNMSQSFLDQLQLISTCGKIGEIDACIAFFKARMTSLAYKGKKELELYVKDLPWSKEILEEVVNELYLLGFDAKIAKQEGVFDRIEVKWKK